MENSFEKLINRVLDNRYKIENVVGIGGMAYVLKAIDLKENNRPVAIKILNEEFNGDENAVKRFVNESKAVAMLDSPNIVKIYDVAISDSLKYIVMEFIDGITLKDYIDKVGKLGWKEACHYVRQILKALSHAHEKGIVHRDIKPQNVMLIRDGTVKVTDFGIAKMPTSEPLTMTDKAIGTVNYISPEQASGGTVDEKSDLYSVGVMFYEMLTGRLPFTADSPVAVAMMQVSEEPTPPRSINAQIPIGLEQIVLKTMSKDPVDRFNSAMSMEKAIEFFVNNPATVFSGVPSGETKKSDKNNGEKKRSMLPVVLGITVGFIAMCVIVALVAFFGFRGFIENFFGGASKDSGKQIKVSDYVGMEYTDELKAQLEADFYTVVVKNVENEKKDNNIILRQNPEAGDKIYEPKKNKQVTLTLYVNKNREKNYIMPEYKKRDVDDVIDIILERFAGIVTEKDIKVVRQYDDSFAKDMVIEANFAEGAAIDINKPSIVLYVSDGAEPKNVKMPDVIGLDIDEARNLFEKEDIYFVETTVVDPNEKTGTVVSVKLSTEDGLKNISAGDEFENSNIVEVGVVGVDMSEQYIMPNVVNKKQSDAVSAVKKNLKITDNEIEIIGEYNADVDNGIVFKTEPAAKTIVVNQTVKLYVSLGKEPEKVELPDVIGMDATEAKGVLEKAGFDNVEIEYGTWTAEAETVVTTIPSPGENTAVNSVIILKVSNGMGDILGEAGRQEEN